MTSGIEMMATVAIDLCDQATDPTYRQIMKGIREDDWRWVRAIIRLKGIVPEYDDANRRAASAVERFVDARSRSLPLAVVYELRWRACKKCEEEFPSWNGEGYCAACHAWHEGTARAELLRIAAGWIEQSEEGPYPGEAMALIFSSCATRPEYRAALRRLLFWDDADEMVAAADRRMRERIARRLGR